MRRGRDVLGMGGWLVDGIGGMRMCVVVLTSLVLMRGR